MEDVLVLPDGSIAVAGGIIGRLAIGPDPSTTQARQGFVALFDRDGSLIWVQQLRGTGKSSVVRLGVRGGLLILYGWFSERLTLGTTTLHSIRADDLFVAEVSLRDGENGRVLAVQSQGWDQPSDMKIMGDRILLSGNASGRLSIGTVRFGPEHGDYSFVLELDRQGGVAWSRLWPWRDVSAISIARRTAGGVYLGGWFRHEMRLADTALESHGHFDFFLTALDP